MAFWLRGKGKSMSVFHFLMLSVTPMQINLWKRNTPFRFSWFNSLSKRQKNVMYLWRGLKSARIRPNLPLLFHLALPMIKTMKILATTITKLVILSQGATSVSGKSNQSEPRIGTLKWTCHSPFVRAFSAVAQLDIQFPSPRWKLWHRQCVLRSPPTLSSS